MGVPAEGSMVWVDLKIGGTHTSYDKDALAWYRRHGVSSHRRHMFWDNTSVVLVDPRTGKQIKILNGNHRLKVAKETGRRFKARVKYAK